MTQNKELTEKVARAICKADGKNPNQDWRDTPNGFLAVHVNGDASNWTQYVSQAQAAITALQSEQAGVNEELLGALKLLQQTWYQQDPFNYEGDEQAREERERKVHEKVKQAISNAEKLKENV